MTRPWRSSALPVGWLCCWLSGLPSCDRSEQAKPAPPRPSASAPKPHQPTPTCKAARPGAYYTLGDEGESRKQLKDAGSDDVELPFAVELGTALSYGKGYAVAALTNHAEGSMVAVAIVSGDAREGRLLRLGTVHGDVVPPRLAADGENLVAAIVDNDAGSQTVRVVAIQPAAKEPVFARGRVFSQGRDDSSAFDISFSAKSGLLVWDRYDKSRGHVVLEASSFRVSALADGSTPRIVSQDGDDAEMPRIVPRPGGFWLTYVAHGPPAPKESVDASDDELQNVVDITPRQLTILPLDASGVPSGKAQRLTDEGSHVLAYDVASDDQGVLMAWRDDPTTLGVEAPVVHLASVKPDGSIEAESLEDEEFGAGAPVLLVERSRGKLHPWLGVMGSDQVLRLSTVAEGPTLSPPAPLAKSHRLSEPLVRSAADLLLAKPRGRVVDLSVVRCEER